MLRELATDRLIRERAIDESYDRLWELECRARGPLSVVERLRFRVLHQQFTGSAVPGLSQSVQLARTVWNRWKGIRQ